MRLLPIFLLALSIFLLLGVAWYSTRLGSLSPIGHESSSPVVPYSYETGYAGAER